MSGFQIKRGFFESPHPATYFLLTANIVIYALCVNQSGGTDISGALLFRNGAMYTQAIVRQEYWRLVAAGFLHAGLLHIATNMICLALWGGHLEKRVGPAYFVVIYVCALIGGSIASNLIHTNQYLGVGASGAISGVLGALLCLRLLGNLDLPLNFFAINIALNIALAFAARNIDWAAHAGGFAVGLVACAGLDVVEKANAYLLRCKFPEFAKMNLLLSASGCLFLVWWLTRDAVFFGVPGWLPLLMCAVVCLVAVKLFDVVLSQRRGLAVTVVGLSVANGMLLLVLTAMLAPRGCAAGYAPAFPRMRDLLIAICTHANVASLVVAIGALVLTLLLYSQELHRGLKDIGFVAASMTGERKRRYGL
jgi:rhomboid protease GluP